MLWVALEGIFMSGILCSSAREWACFSIIRLNAFLVRVNITRGSSETVRFPYKLQAQVEVGESGYFLDILIGL